MHKYWLATFNNINTVILPIKVISNYLDYYRIKIISSLFSTGLILEDIITLISHWVWLNKVTLNNALKVNKKGLYSSFEID